MGAVCGVFETLCDAGLDRVTKYVYLCLDIKPANVRFCWEALTLSAKNI